MIVTAITLRNFAIGANGLGLSIPMAINGDAQAAR